MILNGEYISLQDISLQDISLQDLLVQYGWSADLIALEVNGKIIPRSEFDTLILRQDDRIEIVSFVGGG